MGDKATARSRSKILSLLVGLRALERQAYFDLRRETIRCQSVNKLNLMRENIQEDIDFRVDCVQALT